MSGWRECEIKEIVHSANTGLDAIKRAPIVDRDTGIKCLRIQDVSQEKKYEDWGFAEVEQRNFNKFQLKKNDIIVARTGASIGVNKIIEEDLCSVLNNGLIRIRVNEALCDSKYLFYNFRTSSYNAFIESISGGTSTQPNMQINALLSYGISIPPLPEQKAIAAVLSSLDDKIDLLHRQNANLKAMAETLFRQWFVVEAREDWVEVRVADFVKINDTTIGKGYPHRTIEYLDTGSLTEGKIESFQSYELKDAPSRAMRVVQHNDVLISTVRPNQKHYGIIKNPINNLIVSTGFCVLTCTKIDPHFIYLLLTSDETTEYLHSVAEGSTSTYPSLKPSDIASILFQLPPYDKINKFSELATKSWEKIEKNYAQIRTLEKLRDTLLPKLMSGEVRVTVEDEELTPVDNAALNIEQRLALFDLASHGGEVTTTEPLGTE